MQKSLMGSLAEKFGRAESEIRFSRTFTLLNMSLISCRYIEILRDHRPRHIWDEYSGEHYFSYKRY